MKNFWLIIIILILSSFVFSQEARKIEEIENLSCEDFLSRRDHLMIMLNENPNALAYILVYEGKISYFTGDQLLHIYPRFGEAKEYIRTMKKWMQFGKFPLDKAVFVNRGFREKLTVEFWFVPNGATPPKPTPTLKKMKYRKGKPVSFCAGCC